MRAASIEPEQPEAVLVRQPRSSNEPSVEPSSGTTLSQANSMQTTPEVVLAAPKLLFFSSEDDSDSFDAPSPNLHIDIASQRRGATPQDERNCKQTWVMCAALCGPLLISGWLFWLPFLFSGNTTMLTIAATQPVTTPVKDPFRGVPHKCSANATAQDYTSFQTFEFPTPPGPSRHRHYIVPKSLFCLFNNSQFSQFYNNQTNKTLAYPVQAFPLELCEYVVYWSLGVEDGELKSRTPVLDQTYGLYQIRTAAKNSGIPDIGVLVALGGYGADLPHFSTLRSNATLMARFERNLLYWVQQIPLNGVTIDWATAPDECHGSSDTADLNALLRAIRGAFRRSQQPDKLVTVMLGHGASNVALAESVADVVDLFFVGTHKIQVPPPSAIQDLCSSISTLFAQAMRPYLAATKISRRKLCTTESLALLVAPAVETLPGSFVVIPGEPLAREKFLRICLDPHLCRDTQASGSCMVLMDSPTKATHGVVTNFYMLSDKAAIKSRTTTLFGALRTDACTMVVDHDYDHFGNQCQYKGFSSYVLMLNLRIGMDGYNGTTQGTIPQVSQPCFVPGPGR
ncbi:hypothetical protein HPB48_017313 [Haemaphysalis longicornis]|uniref:GH18 domain-containing protein n=1 Tax=Haemaphysalis longicornis TaxID=44386 RepID=A0A9J6H0J2_HAELO|nr:hypothetical protein HPB48_017313 [Haemaphysalis longicornis]